MLHGHHEKLIGITSMGERGQVVIPAKIRDELKLDKGDKLLVFARHRHSIGIVKFDDMSGLMKKWLSKIESMN
ncbi:MAG: AbrB/MazE/SpoVT family DNA-binding domain-containing protein [Patescibacteria group bacterium]|jgi:AbrB family looped-hinge helix DNA binding protein